MFRVIPILDQINVLERLIREYEVSPRRAPACFNVDEINALKSLAKELRVRLPGAESRTLRALEERMNRLEKARLPDGEYDLGAQRNLVIHLISHWPVLRAALLAQGMASTGVT
jgi:hypothetical protein